MANGNGLSLEGMHQEVEKLGGLVRSLSTQLASVRVRVSGLEHWGSGLSAPTARKAELKLMGKDGIKKQRPGKYPRTKLKPMAKDVIKKKGPRK